MTITCPVCRAEFPYGSVRVLVEHFLKVHHAIDGFRGDNICRCFCGQAFKDLPDLKRHLSEECARLHVAEQAMDEAGKRL
jgi:hypothetical protein